MANGINHHKEYCMNSLKITMLSAFALAFVACDSSEVQMVKGGTLQSCPDKTVEQMVNGYMGNPEWHSLVAEDGNDYVNVVGEISYDDQPTKAEIQFRLNKEKSTFQFHAWELGGKPAPDIVAAVLLEKMCYADLEDFAKELVEARLNMENMNQDEAFASALESEGKDLAEKCKHFAESEEDSELQGMYKAMSCMEENTTNQELKSKVQALKASIGVILKAETLSEERKKVVEKYVLEDPRMAKQNAKKEASVIEFAMRSFKRMLEAYFVESFSFGTWRAIDYKPAKTSSFMFKEISKPDQNTGTTLAAEGIQAISLIDLAGCPARSSWTMLCVPDMNDITKCDCSIQGDNKEACAEITPDFMNLCK